MDEETLREYEAKVQRAWGAWVARAKTATFEERGRLYAEYMDAYTIYKLARQTLAETRGEDHGR